MINLLSKFKTEKNYLNNQRCGLHLHIGSKDRKISRTIQDLICNYDFIQKMQKASDNFCKCQIDRFNFDDSYYYKKYYSKKDLLDGYFDGEKYKFVRFYYHYNTCEFRFLSPCKHKIANVKKTIQI